MYICNCCGTLRQRLGCVREYHYELASMPYEEHSDTDCPACGARDSMEEARICEECDEYILRENSRLTDDLCRLCPRCFEAEERNLQKRRRMRWHASTREFPVISLREQPLR